MANSQSNLDLVLSQRYRPEFGGSIRWMHEVYRRWPSPVTVVTHDYRAAARGLPRELGARQGSGDEEPNLRLDRRDIFLCDWGLDRLWKWQRYGRMTSAVGQHLRAHAAGRPDWQARIHCTHAVPEVVSLLPLRWRYGRRLRIVCYAHGEEITACASSGQLRWLMRQAHRAVDVFIANSRYTAGQLMAQGVEESRIAVIHPGVDVADLAGAEEAGQKLRGARGWVGRRLVLTLGRLDPRKNQAAVIEAVARLSGRCPSLLYVIAGDGRERESLAALARARDVEDRVVLLGSVSDDLKRALLGACDIFSMPAVRDGTDVEGFGMVFLEAGACGKPVIAGKEGGQPDAVVDWQTGLIVDGTDQAAVTAALDRLLADPGMCRYMGQAGRRRAAEFDWPTAAQRVVAEVQKRLGPR